MYAQFFGDNVDFFIFILILFYFCNKIFYKNIPTLCKFILQQHLPNTAHLRLYLDFLSCIV